MTQAFNLKAVGIQILKMISVYANKKKRKQKRITKTKQTARKHMDPRAGLLVSLKKNLKKEGDEIDFIDIFKLHKRMTPAYDQGTAGCHI